MRSCYHFESVSFFAIGIVELWPVGSLFYSHCYFHMQAVTMIASRIRPRHGFRLAASASARRNFTRSSILRKINKLCPSSTTAIQSLKSGSTVLVGGFGFSGVPSTLIDAVAARQEIKDLTVVSNNAGMPGVGLGQLLDTRQISKMIASFIGENKVFEKMYLSGDLSLELIPQGTMAEKCAAGAAGVPAFYTPAAYGTIGMLSISRIGMEEESTNSTCT